MQPAFFARSAATQQLILAAALFALSPVGQSAPPAPAAAPAPAPTTAPAATTTPPAAATSPTAVVAPEVAARAWLVLDATSGSVLAAKNETAPIEPASLTKLMTAYVTFQALREQRIKLDQVVQISQTAYKASGSRMFIDPATSVTVEELLKGLIIQSGNDAAIALAELQAGSEGAFANVMNQTAQNMGLTQTRFVNATGLPDPQHTTTAADLSRLATRLIQDFPDRLSYYSTKDYTYNKIKQPNRNRLLWLDPTVDGLKTGHTDSAGWCLIATAKRDQPLGDGQALTRRVLAVVLGTASDSARTQEAQKLLNWGFGQFDTVRLYRSSDVLGKIPVYKGASDSLNLTYSPRAGVAQDLYVTLPKGAAARVQARLEQPKYLVAPIAAGQTVATLHLSLDGRPLSSVPLLAPQAIAPAGWFARMVDSIKLML